MKKKILLLLLVATSMMGQVRVQNMVAATASTHGFVAYQTTSGVGNCIQNSDDTKLNHLLHCAKSNATTPIEITDWADKTGSTEQNEKKSLRRALATNSYLVGKGVAKEVETKQVETTVVAETPRSDAQPTQVETSIERTKKEPFRWYAGIESGVSMGVSTLSSFAPKGGAGWNVGVLGGYRISPLLSAEVGISFGGLKLGATTCCQDYFLGADGVRYLSHVAGMDSYSYKDIYSSVSMQQYALRLNIDMLQIVNADWNKRWSLNLSPAIYGISSKATLKTSNTTIIKRDSQFQFAAGVGIGVGYQINKNLGVGIRSGAAWVFGKRYDGIAPTDHKENIVWNNTVTLTWRFGCKK